MPHSADPANATAADQTIAEKYLQDGEIIILAIKPSGWFILISSFPVLVVAGVIAAGAFLAGGIFRILGSSEALLFACSSVASIRLIVGCFQWVGRFYLLTNRRVMQIRSVFRVELYSIYLKEIKEVLLSAGPVERTFGVGSLYFDFLDTGTPQSNWKHISNPAGIQKMIQQAIESCRGH